MVLLISYDLTGHERPSSYARVRAYVERHARSFQRPLYSQWLVESDAGPQQWVDALRNNGLIDSGDRLFVCQVRRPYQGWLANDVWDWLNPRT